MRRFIILSVVLFLLIVTVGSVAFSVSMRQIIKENKNNELRRILEIERIKLENLVNSEIAIVLKMADSPLIKQYFAFPDDAELKKIAFDEIAAYRRAFTAQSVFWVNDIDKMFYFNDAEPYYLNPENKENYWYSMTLYETQLYNFNINYNPDLGITNLWINAPVRDGNGKPVGMMGTGIDLSTFLEMIYKDYTGKADIYFFNAAGEITGAKDTAPVAQKKQIGEKFNDVNESIISAAKSLESEQIHTLDSSNGSIAIGAVPLLEWYAVAVIPDGTGDYYNAMTSLFIIMLIIIALVFVICNAVIARLLKPLRKAMAETEAAFRVAEYDIMKYRLTSDALNLAHWDMDIAETGDPVNPKNSIIYSPEFRRMIGFSDETDFPNVLSSWTTRLHPDDYERVMSAFAAHINDRTGKTPYNLEWRLMMKNGEYRYFHAFGSTVRDDSGAPLRVAGALRDITNIKLIEGELAGEYAKSEATAHWYKSILDATPLPISVTDINMNWTFVNKAVEDFLGMKREDMMGEPCSKWNTHICNTSDCGIACAKRGLKRTFFTNNEYSYQVDVEILENLKGEPDGFIEVVQDITKVETMAREQAEAENKAKSLFLASMSHEIRTPINAIIGMTAIGRKAEDIDRKDYALNKIEDASSHLLGVVNDILDMSKIEADKLELSPVEFNFEQMIQKITAVINFRVEEKRQRLTLDIAGNLPHFMIGDDQRLTQVITNLLSNAVKFTPEEGKIRLGISLASENGGICELRIEVSDNGIGMTAEQQEKLFEAFSQADSGISREYGGTGLGLAISKRIVELMDGEIWAESEIGQGTNFIFTVKVRRGAKSQLSLTASGVSWENVRVLVVDDAAETREQFKNLFDHLNIKYDMAENGFEAYAMLEEHGQYDIYFIDWRMPGMDGIQLTQRIKSREDCESSVAIMITSADWDSIKDDALKAGVNKYLIKPLSSSMIIDCMNECLIYEQPEEDEDASGIKSGMFEGKRLLLAEDMAVNREIIRSLLEDTGLIIDYARNGREALDMVEAAPDKFDIVLMDVQMPHMDGLEATRRIRALPALKGVALPIISMTANVFKEDIENCLAAGMDDHLGKPIDIDIMVKKLRKYLKV
jgi:PAS domain S-box-containing protein